MENPKIDILKERSARVFSRLYAGRELALIPQLFHPQYVQKPVGYSGHAGVERYVLDLHAAFSDPQFDLAGQIGEGDSVANLLVMTGRHTGALLGHIPATGREVMVVTVFVHRYYDGLIVEGVLVSDQLGLMQQLGVVPTPVWGTEPGITG